MRTNVEIRTCKCVTFKAAHKIYSFNKGPVVSASGDWRHKIEFVCSDLLEIAGRFHFVPQRLFSKLCFVTLKLWRSPCCLESYKKHDGNIPLDA